MRYLGFFVMHGKRTALLACFLPACVFFCYPLANQCHAAILQEIDVVSADESTEVILRIDKKARFKHKYLPATDSLPARCYIDLYNTSYDKSLPPWLQVDGQHISKIRNAIYSKKLRIVFDLKKDYTCSIASPEADSSEIHISVTEKASLKARKTTFPQAESSETLQSSENNLNPTGIPAVAETETWLSTAPSSDATTVTSEPTVATDTQLSVLTPADSDGMSAWGWAQLYAAHDTHKDPAEDHSLYRLKGRLGADWRKDLSLDNSLKLTAAIDLDRLFYDDDLADEETDIRLHETFLQLNNSNWDIAFGNQRVRWGKSDQLSPIDSINPQDFRQFVTVELEERALPSWLLRNRWHGEMIGLETVVQPWFKKSELEYFDSDWALYRNLRQSIIANPLAPGWLKDYARNIRVDEDKPENTLENLSAAVRFTWKTEQTDFAISYHYGWETLPTITEFPVKNISFSGDPDIDPVQLLANAEFTNARVQAEYRRQQTVGFEWETELDPIGFRGEIAYIDQVAFLSSDLTSERKPVTHLVSGIDYTSANEWYFNLQGSWYRIHDYADEILYFEKDTVSVLGEISKPVWRGNLELALKYNYTITDQSSYLQPSVTFKYFPNLRCEIGANIFSGDGETLLGSYDRADQVYGVIKLSAN